MRNWFLKSVLPNLLKAIFILWCRTLLFRSVNHEAERFYKNLSGKGIITLWHNHIFYLFYYLRKRPELHLLISPSKDGDFLANLGRLMGYSIIRGSSYKKAVPAARSLIKVLRQDEKIVIVADGSRGPRHKAQLGSLQLASITGSPVIPMAFNASRKIELNSWDRFVVPLPFSRCRLNVGSPIYVPRGADENLLQEKQIELEASLLKITSESGSL